MATELTDDLAARLDRVPGLAGVPRTISELPGGLTNRNYKVTTPDGVYVARLWSGGGDFLAINRDYEHHNSVAAAQAGVGARVVAYRPEDNLLVLEFIEGRTFSDADVQNPANIPRIAQACRRLHSGPRFLGDFDMFVIQGRYAAVTAELGFRVPAGYDALMPQVESARRALAVRAGPTVPCNNDLLAANFIDDGVRLWLIDYEYSGNNDPCFELGNIWGESGLSGEAWPAWSPATTAARCGTRLPAPSCLASSASTAGPCGGRSRPQPARSSSTSGPGRWPATRAQLRA